jgi:hypothetical protein
MSHSAQRMKASNDELPFAAAMRMLSDDVQGKTAVSTILPSSIGCFASSNWMFLSLI